MMAEEWNVPKWANGEKEDKEKDQNPPRVEGSACGRVTDGGGG